MCGSGVNRQMRRSGRSVSGKDANLLSRDLGDAPCLSLSRENSSSKALRRESSCPKHPRAARVSGGAACWSCLPKSYGGRCM